MSKRLQVVLEDKELREIERAARQRGLTVSEWVRQSLREARRGSLVGAPTRKLQVIRASAKHGFPTSDIDQMIREIEAGYGGSGE